MSIFAEIGRKGLTIPLVPFRNRIGDPLLKKILNALSITENVIPGRPNGMARTTRKAYMIENLNGIEMLIIPRCKGAVLMRTYNKAGIPLLNGIVAAPLINSDGTPYINAPLPVPRRISESRLDVDEPLYEYQETVINFLCNNAGPFNNGGVAYLQMDTGLGKTRVGCGVVVHRAEPALIIVPTDAIANQWVDEFAILYPKLKVDIFRNPPKVSKKIPPNSQSHDVVIIIVNTYRDKTPEFLEGYGTIILDEAHEYHSVCNSRALWLSQANAVLGLSATPIERPDGLDKYVPLHLGAVIESKKIPGFDIDAVKFKCNVRIVNYAGNPEYCETVVTPAGTMSAILTIGNMMKDPARLKLVAAEISRLYNLHITSQNEDLVLLGLGPRPAEAAVAGKPVGEIRRHGVFVFAEHRLYLPMIREALLETMHPDDILTPELDTPPEISMLRGGVSKTAVGDARMAGSHIVLTTYGFSRRGISLADMTSIVLATPRRNGSRQILGRILRRGSDESIVRQIVDIVDTRTGLRGQLTDRKKIYIERKYSISKVSISCTSAADEVATSAAAEVDEVNDELQNLSLDDLLDVVKSST